MSSDNLKALLDQEKDDDFDKLREESRQAEPPEPDTPSRASSPPADAQTPPSPKAEPPEELVEAKRVVPEAVFLEEKNERKRLERLYQEQAERQARIEERHRIWEERLKAAQAPAEPPVPDKAQDPVGYLEHQIQQARKEAAPVQELQQRLAAYEQQQRIAATVSGAEQEFAAKTQDYFDAVEHLRSVRMRQYELAGLTQDEQQQALMADTRNWVLATLQKGKNPAEATYELARAYGYAAKPARDLAADSGADSATKPRNPDGTFAPKPPDPKVEKAKETLKTVERGQQAAKSLGDSVGGTANTDLPSMSELATMSDEEFDRVTAGKNWKKFFV
jgi:hypothetical protein